MLNVGIVGTGNISAAHIRSYLQYPDQCRITALCDIEPDKAEGRRTEFGLTDAQVYDSVEAMLAAQTFDVISVCTPPSAHAPVTIAALNAGVNVIGEKPMAPSLEECDAMIAAAETAGKTLGSIAQNRYRDDMATLKAAIDSGLLGDISHVKVDSLWSRAVSYYDLWWRGTWESEGGGCTLNHAIHHLDLTLWLLGRPKAVTAVLANTKHDNAEVEDLSVAILQYDRALAEVTSSTVHHGEEQSIVVQGTLARVSQPWKVIADTHHPSGFIKGQDEERVAALEKLAADHVALEHTGHAGQIGDFLDAVATGRKPGITGADGRNAVELVTAIYESGIEHRTVQFPLSTDDPYYKSGTLVARAPHFYEKTNSLRSLSGDITVGSSGS